MRLDRSRRYEETSGDRLVREPFRNDAKNLSLALGQLGERAFAAATPDEARDDRRIDDGLPVGDPAKGVDQDGDLVGLAHKN